MGVRSYAIVFPFEGTKEELISLVHQLGNIALSLGSENKLLSYFEPEIYRYDKKVLVHNFPVFDLLKDPNNWEKILSEQGINFEFFLAHIYLTFSDNYGYGLYKSGKHIRTAYISIDDEEPTYLGETLDLEIPYLTAPYHYIDIEDDDEPKYKELPSEILPTQTFVKVFTVENKEYTQLDIVATCSNKLWEEYLGFDFFDNYPTPDEIIPLFPKQEVKVEEKSSGNRLINFFKKLF